MNTNKQKLQALAALFTAFPSQERTGNEKQLVQIYLEAVQEVPATYVERAVRDFVRGDVERQNHTFRPSCAEVAKRAREHFAPTQRLNESRRRMEEQRALEGPPPLSAERRKQIVEEAMKKFKPQNTERV